MKTLAISPTSLLASIPAGRAWSQQLLHVLSAVTLLGVGASSVRAQSNYPGSIDTSFNVGTGPDAAVLAIASQSDGKTIIGGVFANVDGVARPGIARLNTDGSLDTAFNPATGSNGQVNVVNVLSSGSILVGGSFSTFGGTTHVGIVRLTPTGAVDGSFEPAVSSTSGTAITAILVQSDNKIVLPGGISSAGDSLLLRLEVNGNLDSSFNFGTGANGLISALALQGDGKILVGGSFSTVNGVARAGIARLNANGSVDTTFNPGAGANGSVLAVAIQGDGKIVFGGTFSQVNGSTRDGIARLNADGSLDGTFAPTSDDFVSINAILVQPNGSVIFGGNFDDYDGYYVPDIVAVLADGSIDNDFVIFDGANSTVEAMAYTPSGQLLIAGIFTQASDQTAQFVARLNDDTHPVFFTGEVSLGSGVYYLALPEGNNFGEYSYLTDPNYIYSYDLSSYEYLIDANDFNEGLYLYDFASGTFFYTSPYFPYPYLYDFTLNSVLYFYQGTSAPRYFFNFGTGQIITK